MIDACNQINHIFVTRSFVRWALQGLYQLICKSLLVCVRCNIEILKEQSHSFFRVVLGL